jgi:hypothetical protein
VLAPGTGTGAGAGAATGTDASGVQVMMAWIMWVYAVVGLGRCVAFHRVPVLCGLNISFSLTCRQVGLVEIWPG